MGAYLAVELDQIFEPLVQRTAAPECPVGCGGVTERRESGEVAQRQI